MQLPTKVEKATASAVIVAAGSSARMGKDKMLLPLLGKPVIIHTLLAFQRCHQISEIILVTREESIPQLYNITQQYPLPKLRQIVAGGESRGVSVRKGVEASSRELPLLCVHDGARPLVSQEVILDCLKLAEEYGCATAVVPLKDTVKNVRDGMVVNTPNRASLMAAQTPQCFNREVYLAAYRGANGEEYSDDCMLVEAAGGEVALSKGDYRNLKLTTFEDIIIAAALMNGGEAQCE